MPEWKSVDRYGLPTEDAKYIVFAPTADPEIPLKTVAWYSPEYGWSLINEYWIPYITHWMPMPADPIPEAVLATGNG